MGKANVWYYGVINGDDSDWSAECRSDFLPREGDTIFIDGDQKWVDGEAPDNLWFSTVIVEYVDFHIAKGFKTVPFVHVRPPSPGE